MALVLSLALACLVQASPVFRPIQNPEDYLLGLNGWFSALLVVPVLGISYACILASYFVMSALTTVLRLALVRTRLLGFARYVTCLFSILHQQLIKPEIS